MAGTGNKITDLRVKAQIDGKDHQLQFHSLHVSQSFFEPTTIRLELGYTKPDERKKLKDMVSHDLAVTISDAVNTKIEQQYSGIITGYSHTEDSIILEAHSKEYLMTAGRKYRVFVENKISDIVQSIAGEYGLQADIKSTNSVFKHIQQYGETDWEFITRLASYCGCLFYFDGKTFFFSDAFDENNTVEIAEEDLDNFVEHFHIDDIQKKRGAYYNPELHNEPSHGTLKHSTLSQMKDSDNKDIAGVTKVFDAENTDDDFNTPFREEATLKDFLKARENRTSAEFLRLEGETHHPMAVLGKTIADTKWVIVKLDATFNENVYTAKFEAMPHDIPLSPETPEIKHGYLLQPGVVTNNKDDKKLGRVKVQYHWSNEQESFWARVSQPGAGGPSHGTHFTPRVGDMVLVGFENGDVSSPVVLGSLYHSEKAPEFKTENGGAEVLVAKTPVSTIHLLEKQDADEITISMKETKNIIKMEIKGPKITIESIDGTVVVHSKTIQITADETIEMKAKTIELKATENVKISASKDITVKAEGNFEATASQNAKLSGTSEATVSSTAKASITGAQVESTASATNTIKGALVQIN